MDKQKPVGLGVMVQPSIVPPNAAASITVPYIIAKRGETVAHFDITTTKVTAPVTINIYAYSGGTTVSQPFTIMP